MTWISAEDQLPKINRRVLVSISRGITIARYVPKYHEEADFDYWEEKNTDYNKEKDEWYIPEGWYETDLHSELDTMILEGVTHWMPLPEVPKFD